MKFYTGQFFEHDGIEYRVIAGNRCDGDMKIMFKTNGWKTPKIAHSFILAEFKFQVEENNYGISGKVKKGRGGWYLMDKIRLAVINGWEAEAEHVAKQRADLLNT